MTEPVITVEVQGDPELPTVDFTFGLPASGKSTWTKAEQAADPTIVRVNNDDLGRAMSTGRTKENGALLAAVRGAVLAKGIEQGRRVVVDNTNLSPKAQAEILRAAEKGGRTVRRIDFTGVGLEECVRRDALRTGREQVGRVVIEKMYVDFLAGPGFEGVAESGNLFFTSDLHFGHANILGFGRDKVFSDLDSMNAGLIERWNSVVGPDDTVFVLGDVAMGHRDQTLPLVGKLNGIKHLIAGNHDNCWEHAKNPAKWKERYSEFFESIRTTAILDTEKGPVRLHHFPYSGDHTEEDRYPHARPIDDGMPLLHGHVHDLWQVCYTKKGTIQINVGVDVWDYAPVSVEILLSRLNAS